LVHRGIGSDVLVTKVGEHKMRLLFSITISQQFYPLFLLILQLVVAQVRAEDCYETCQTALDTANSFGQKTPALCASSTHFTAQYDQCTYCISNNPEQGITIDAVLDAFGQYCEPSSSNSSKLFPKFLDHHHLVYVFSSTKTISIGNIAIDSSNSGASSIPSSASDAPTDVTTVYSTATAGSTTLYATPIKNDGNASLPQKSFSSGMIAGVVIGLLLVVLGWTAAYILHRRAKKRHQRSVEADEAAHEVETKETWMPELPADLSNSRSELFADSHHPSELDEGSEYRVEMGDSKDKGVIEVAELEADMPPTP